MNDLHHHIITEHRTKRYESPTARVSIRRERGRFVVRFRDIHYKKRSRTEYKTLDGALIAVDMIRRTYF